MNVKPLLILLLACTAAATDADDVLRALTLARSRQVQGVAQVTVNFPPRPQPTRQARHLPFLPVRGALLARNFDVRRSQPERVAGRTANRYELTPKLGNAARWRVWVDAQWKLPLAFEESGANGTVARRAAFVKVNGPPVTVSQPLAPVPRGLPGAVQRALPGVKFPAGFVPVEARTRGNRSEVTLSDGMNLLLLIAAPRDVQAAPGVASRRVDRQFVWLTGNLPTTDLMAALGGIRAWRPSELGTFLTAPPSNP